MNEGYVPRFSFEITEELKERTNTVLTTHGLRKALMTLILEDVLDLIAEHGNIVVGLILDGAVKPREVIRTLAQAEKKARKAHGKRKSKSV